MAASLHNGKGNTRNGIVGIVLPCMYEKVYKGRHFCNKCGCYHSYVEINDSTVIREFSYNYYTEPHQGCSWTEEQRYCVLAKWDDFLKNPEDYIERAFSKRNTNLANNEFKRASISEPFELPEDTMSAVLPGVEIYVPSDELIDYKETSSGIMLTLRNLQFESDSAVLLPGENERLDMIAAALKKAPGSMFLIGGHAASTGNPAGEQKVSEDRAKAIAQALIARGINPDMIMCRGYGSTVPQSTNDTPEGRAMNRRVEITILE